MNRRGFIKALIGTAAAILAPPIPFAPTAPDAPLAFHPDYFSMVIDDFRGVTRMDCLYGFAVLRPELMCRIAADDEPQPRGFLRYVEREKLALTDNSAI